MGSNFKLAAQLPPLPPQCPVRALRSALSSSPSPSPSPLPPLPPPSPPSPPPQQQQPRQPPPRLPPDQDAVDVLLRDTGFTPHLVAAAPDDHLLPLLPLLLASPELPALLPPLRERLHASRMLKLRFLLLRAHPAFQSVACTRRFASWAYANRPKRKDAQRRLAQRKWAPERAQGDDDADRNAVSLVVDMVDLQSEEFYRNDLFTNAAAAAPPSSFGHTMVSHIFPAPDDVEPESRTPFDSPHSCSSTAPAAGELVQRAHLRQGGAHPVVELRQICPVANRLEREHTEPVLPEVAVRSADALRHVALLTLLRVFNAAWARPSRQFADAASAPYCAVVDTAIVGKERMLEVTGGKTIVLEDFKFDYWRYTRGQDPVLADSFVRSAAGTFTAAYVLGLAKSGGDIAVVDGREVYLWQLRGAFEYVPQMARLVVPKQMKDAFEALGVMDEFRDTCMRAFTVIRDSHAEVFEVVFDLLKMAGFSKGKVMQYCASKNNLNLGEDRMVANMHFRKWIG